MTNLDNVIRQNQRIGVWVAKKQGEAIGARMRSIMKCQNKRGEDLALECGLSGAAVSRILNGKPTTTKTLCLVAAALGLEVEFRLVAMEEHK